ncbi:MAG TPA: TonB family protein [Flavipsychrobacter sp.]|nr:TonB family protein [Flavipsychrobacter sp.]
MQAISFLSADYLDILFNNRNKCYGSYELRKHYHNRALKAIATVLLGVLSVVVSSFNGEDHPPAVSVKIQEPTILVDIQPIMPTPQQPEIEPHKAIDVATAKFDLPKIVEDDQVNPEETLVENKDLKDKMIGTVNLDGDNTDAITGTDAHIKGDREETPMTHTEVPPATAVHWVSQMPEFDGDLDAYLTRNLKYPALARENDIQGRISVQFVVNADGSISEATLLKSIGGGCDEEALRVVKGMPRWKAGRNNGEAVRVYVILPINFSLH